MTRSLYFIKSPWSIFLTTEKASPSEEKTKMTPAGWLAVGVATTTILGALITYVVSPILSVTNQVRDLKTMAIANEKQDAQQDVAIQSLQASQRETGDKLARIETKIDMILNDEGGSRRTR